MNIKAFCIRVSSFFFFTYFVLDCVLHAQIPIAEIPLNTYRVPESMHATAIGDSIFLIHKEYVTSGSLETQVRGSWIVPGKATHTMVLDALKNKLVVAILTREQSTDIYFLDADQDQARLKLLRIGADSNPIIHETSITLTGQLLGSYIDEDLFLISASPRDKLLHIDRVRDTESAGRKTFVLTFNVLESKRSRVAFIRDGAPVSHSQAVSGSKIYKTDSAVYLTVDEPFYEYGPPQTHFKTSIIELDLYTGKYKTQFIAHQTKAFFTSTLFNKRLYRIIQSYPPELQVFDLGTGRKIYSQVYDLSAFRKQEIGYIRNGKSLSIEKGKLGWLQYPIVSKSDSLEIITVGARLEKSGGFPIVSQFGLVGMIASVLSSAAIQELTPDSETYMYTYLRGTPEAGFTIAQESNTIQQKLDDYEILQALAKKRLDLKAYLQCKGSIYAFYVERKSTSIQVLKFQ